MGLAPPALSGVYGHECCRLLLLRVQPLMVGFCPCFYPQIDIDTTHIEGATEGLKPPDSHDSHGNALWLPAVSSQALCIAGGFRAAAPRASCLLLIDVQRLGTASCLRRPLSPAAYPLPSLRLAPALSIISAGSAVSAPVGPASARAPFGTMS